MQTETMDANMQIWMFPCSFQCKFSNWNDYTV